MFPRIQRTPVTQPTRYLGIDFAANHAAFVQINSLTGLPEQWVIVTDTKSILETVGPRFAISLDLPPSKNSEAKGLFRLNWWRMNLPKILGRFYPDYTAIEDYAFGAKQGAHQLGEVGGMLRLEIWNRGWKWRKYSPTTIKLFTAHKGKAEKEEMVRAVKDRWSADFTYLRPGTTKLWDSAEDAADAYSAAKLLQMEHRLRLGEVKLSSLHEQEIRCFNSVSKASKTNLLDTDWIQKP